MYKLMSLLLVFFLSACHNNGLTSKNDSVSSVDSTAHISVTSSPAGVDAKTAVDSAIDFHYYLVPVIPDTDFMTVNENAAIIVYPDSMQIVTMKREEGDTNFYIGADDANYYIWEASEFLKTKKIKVIYAHNRYIKFETASKPIFFDIRAKISSGWLVILFRKDASPKIVWSTGIKEEYEEYFGKK